MACNFVHQQFGLDGVQLPDVRDLSAEELSILKDFVIDGRTAFNNPVGASINSITSKIASFNEKINQLYPNADDEIPSEIVDLQTKIDALNGNMTEFLSHTNILSGVNLNPPSGRNLLGLSGLASSYNDTKRLLDDLPEGEEAFSSIFGSISKGGADLMADIDGNMDRVLQAMDRVSPGFEGGDLLSDISGLAGGISCGSEQTVSAIAGDLSEVTNADDYINKFNLGRFSISMGQSEALDGVLGDLVVRNDLLQEIEQIPPPEALEALESGSLYKFPPI